MRLATRLQKARVKPRRLRSTRALAMPPASTITFGPDSGTKLGQRVRIALTPDYTLPYWQWGWEDITEFVRWDPGISVTWGRGDEDDTVSSLNASMTLTNDGRFSRKNPFGAYAGKLTRTMPIWAEVNPGDGWHTRLQGYVNSWPKRWDTSGTDSIVPITVGGVMRRLQQDSDDQTAMRRTISGRSVNGCTPLAYWSLEDGEDASQFASALPGGVPLELVGPTLAVDDSLPGSDPLPTFDANSFATAELPSYTDTRQWVAQIEIVPEYPMPGIAASVISFETGNGKVAGGMVPDFGQLVLAWWTDPAGSGPGNVTVGFLPDAAVIQNTKVSLILCSRRDPDGGDDVVSVTIRDERGIELLSVSDTTAVGFHASAVRVNVSGNRNGTGLAGTYGHPAIWVDPAFTIGEDDVPIAKSMLAHTGETATQRLRRECAAALVPFHAADEDTVTLGPQPKGTLMTVARDAEKGGGGVLYEREFGLGYKPRRGYYNQPVHLAVDQAAGQLAEAVQAEDSDYGYVNQWTARRPDGSESTFRDPDMLPGEQLAAGSDSYNVQTDEPLPDFAGWQVHEGTVDEDRWPMLAFNLRNHPELIPQWVALPFGGRVQVSNPHEEAGIDEIDAIVQGGTEHWNSLQWSGTLNTTPATIYDIPRYDDGRARYGARRTVLGAAISASDTSIAVNSNGEKWITTASHPSRFPFALDIGDITYSCTAITGTAPNYTFTIVRLGTDRSHDADTRVRPTGTYPYGF